jgi:hypothetical protein
MKKDNWTALDKQMQRWSYFFTNDVKIPSEQARNIASTIAEEVSNIPDELKEEVAKIVSSPISIQARLDELIAFQGWMDIAHDSKNPYITRAQVIVQNYVCFVYLSEACFKTIKKYLADGSPAKKCCNFLLNNPVRAFRNALAHSNWRYEEDFSGILFYARKGHQTSEPMKEWHVSEETLAFWQALARCTAYTTLSILNQKNTSLC